MSDIKNFIEAAKQEESLSFKQIFRKIRRNWYWFFILGLLGSALGFILSKSTAPTYEVNTVVLFKGESTSSGLNTLFEDLNVNSNTDNIQNELLTLRSITLHSRAVENLYMNISWYKKDLFKKIPMYKDQPFIIEPISGKDNLAGVLLNIKPINRNKIEISADQKLVQKGIKRVIQFKDTINYGVPFNNRYFNFILYKKNERILEPKNKIRTLKNLFGLLNIEPHYLFTFNDLDILSKLYQKNTSISLVNPDAGGIMLSVKDGNADRAKDYLNALIDVYLSDNLNRKNRATENTIRFIDVQLSQLVDTLNTAGKNFTDFRSRNGIVNLSQEADLVVGRLEDLESQRAIARQRIEYFENLKSYIGNSEKADLIVSPSVVGITDVSLNAQLVRLNELYSRKASWSAAAKENNPGILMIDEEINNTLKSLWENINNLLINSKNELEALNERISKINNQLARMPKTEQKLIEIKRTFDLNNDLYTYLLEKRAEAAITNASNVPDAYNLDPAKIKYAEQISPSTNKNVIFGLLIGLLIPFLIVVISDFLNESIESIDDIEGNCKLPVLGQIPRNKFNSITPTLNHPRSNIAESYRTTVLNTLHLNHNKDKQIICVHSMFPGEGKTFNAVNIAMSLATIGKNVLLVGADLRKPKLYKYFNCDQNKGLSTLLDGMNEMDELVTKSDHPNLHYLDAGPVPTNPQALFSNGKFEVLIKNLQADYDYVIVDNAPIYLVSDAFYIAQYATINVFVLRQRKSNTKQLKYINKLNNEKKLSNVGVLLNDVRSNGYNSPYGHKYSSYSYYEEDNNRKKFLWRRN